MLAHKAETGLTLKGLCCWGECGRTSCDRVKCQDWTGKLTLFKIGGHSHNLNLISSLFFQFQVLFFGGEGGSSSQTSVLGIEWTSLVPWSLFFFSFFGRSTMFNQRSRLVVCTTFLVCLLYLSEKIVLHLIPKIKIKKKQWKQH